MITRTVPMIPKYRDRNVSAHHLKGTVDTNKILKQQIIQARKETVSYF